MPVDVTFHNLTVIISGVGGPKEAYDRLCNALASIEKASVRVVEWTSDTYSVCTDGIETISERETSELFPTDDEMSAGIAVRKD